LAGRDGKTLAIAAFFAMLARRISPPQGQSTPTRRPSLKPSWPWSLRNALNLRVHRRRRWASPWLCMKRRAP